MKLGIFAKTFGRSAMEEVWDAVADSGVQTVQFNMACAGMSSMPETADLEVAARVKAEAERRSLGIAAVSGTFNMAHPDPAVRREGVRRLENLAAMCGPMGTEVITLCTGSRDPDNMWRRHPLNGSKEAWRDLLVSMEEALELADRYGVVLAVEPEAANVVSDAARARELLDTLQSDRLKIVMDGANLLNPSDPASMADVLDRAFELLGGDIVVAHAKDLSADGKEFTAAGQGVLDYDRFIALLRQASFEGALIMHGLEERQVPDSVRFLRSKLGQ